MTSWNSKSDFSGSYNDLTNKPDLSNFITNTVDNLVNYYKKSETYTQTEVNNLISAISTMNILVVQTLPTQDISTTTIYLLPRQTGETNNVYDEYIYVSNNWEKIGSTDIDLSNYYTKAEVDTLLANIDLSNYYTKTQVDALIPDISGKQDTLVSGTNIKTINNNSILGSGNVSIQEGETLPVGTEVDFDGQVSDIPVGWEEVEDKGDVYSTTEQRIGTWIDGKPLYRKVIEITERTLTPTNSRSALDIDLSSYNIDLIIDDNASLLCTGNGFNNFIQQPMEKIRTDFGTNDLNNAYNWSISRTEISSSTARIVFGANFYKVKGYYIIEYTKTTDTVGGGN